MVGKEQVALANIDRLVSGPAEDDHCGTRGDVDHGRGTARRVTADVHQAQSVAVGARDVEDLAAIELQVVDGDGVARVGTVVADVEAGRSKRAVDDNVVGVRDDTIIGRSVVLKGEQTSVADGGKGAGEDRGRTIVVEAGEGECARVDRDTTREGVVTAQKQRAETFLGDAVAIAAVIQKHVQGQHRLGRIHGHRRIAQQCGRGVIALDGQVVGALERDLRAAEHQRIAQSIRARGGQVGARCTSGESSGANRAVGECRDDTRRAITRGHVRAATDGEAARLHIHPAAEEARAGELKQAIARLDEAGGADVRGTADRSADGQGRRNIGDGGVAVHRHGIHRQGATCTAKIHGKAAGACTRNGGNSAHVARTGGDVAAEGQDAGAGGQRRCCATVVFKDQSSESLVEVVQVQGG